MNSHHLIATIADEWTAEAGESRSTSSLHGTACGRCSDSDLVSGPRAAQWPHAVLHRLVAPIEEVLDAEVENYVATSPDREQRLRLVDDYRAELRTAARHVVDLALERGHYLGAAAS